MLNPEIIDSNDRFIKINQWEVAKFPQHEIIEKEGVVIIGSNTDNIIFNPIFISEPIRDEADLEARLKAIGDHIKKSKFPWWLIVCEDLLPEPVKSRASEIFARHELGVLLKMIGMETDKVVPWEKPIPELECRRVESLEMGIAAADINAIAHNMPLDSFRDLLGRENFWEENLFCSLGYVEGKPVSTAMTLENEGKLYVGWVATLPEYRNKSYAKKVVCHSVAMAEENSGIYCSVLHGKEQACPVYEKLGYSPVSSFSAYVSISK